MAVIGGGMVWKAAIGLGGEEEVVGYGGRVYGVGVLGVETGWWGGGVLGLDGQKFGSFF